MTEVNITKAEDDVTDEMPDTEALRELDSFEKPAVEKDSILSNPLESLRARRQEIMDGLYVDLPIPRYSEPRLWARFRPLDLLEMNKNIRKRQAANDPDLLVNINADVLAHSCIGVFATVESHPGEKFSLKKGDPHGPWTKFDKDLCEALDLEASGFSGVVRKVFLTQSDLIATAEKLMEFSSAAEGTADTDF